MWDLFLDLSYIYFLFDENLKFCIYSSHIQYFFRNIILSNYMYISQASYILHVALYRYGVFWDAFSHPSDIHFLFTENSEFFKCIGHMQHFSF